MRNMMKYGKKYGGANPELIEGDIFRIIIKVPEFSENPSLFPDNRQTGVHGKTESGPESGPESIHNRVLLALGSGPLSKSEIATALGHKSVSGKLNQRVREMLAKGLIDYTIPDKPQSRMQKYFITTKGKEKLEKDL